MSCQRSAKKSSRQRQTRARLRKTLGPLQVLSERDFVKTYRLDKETVKTLAEELTPYIRKERRYDGISIMTKILTALAFLATGSYQNLLGPGAHHISQPAVSRAVREVIEALNKLYQKYIPWPTLRQERNKLKSEFYQKFGIPGILGCIDGTHVAIIRPQDLEERYSNSKRFHSLNIMIICDANLNILCVDSSSPGSTDDSHVWQSHPLSSHLTEITNNGEQVYLLGDSGYPLRSTMMTPILNSVEGTPQHHFNTKHGTARKTVERCIDILKARFRCLLVARKLHYSPITAGKIVNACAVLHNIASANNAPIPTLSPKEARQESVLQQKIAKQMRASAEISLQNNASSPVEPDLLAGRALQKTLVNRLWMDRS